MTVLERETAQIVAAVTQKTIGQGPSISLRELLAADVLPAVKTFFRADVEALLLEEHRAALKQSRFAYDHPEVKSAQAQYHSALVMHYVFRRKEFLARLTDAVNLLTNFFVRPQWTLTGVVFERDEAISVESLRRLMGYFAPYEYLRDVLFRYASDRKITAFTKSEFSGLLWKIDSAFVRRKSGRELCDALIPMYEFFEYPRSTGRHEMPLKALIKYCEDKGLTDAVTRLEGELAQGLTDASLDALAGILEDVRQTTGGFNAERPEAKIQEILPAGSGAAGTPSPRAGTPAPGPGTAGSGAGVTGTGGRREGPDISVAIQDGERKKFVRKIFKQEDAMYQEAVARLSGMSSWKEASKYIDEIFIRNDVDPYCGEAERFIEIVFQQYHPPR